MFQVGVYSRWGHVQAGGRDAGGGVSHEGGVLGAVPGGHMFQRVSPRRDILQDRACPGGCPRWGHVPGGVCFR